MSFLKKRAEKIVAITAYDALFAAIFDGEVDFLLVGDSLVQSFFGARDTNCATMRMMIYHTKAVCNGAKNTPIVADMPFGSYFDEKSALKNAKKFYQKTGANAVKLEGGVEKTKIVRALTENGIAVMAHIGLTPQTSRAENGYFLRGRDTFSQNYLTESALALQEAGAFAIVLEGIYEFLPKKPAPDPKNFQNEASFAQKITDSLRIPTIGIGSGRGCDGQILVFSDVLGLFLGRSPKFVRQFLDGKNLIKDAIKRYKNAVKTGDFPNENESYR